MNIDRKYKYYDEGVLPEEGEYGVTYLTLYSSNAGNVYDGWIWDPEHKTTESAIERTFGFRNSDYQDYCYDDEVVVDLSNPQTREESEFEQGRITSFNTNVSSSPIFIPDAGDVSALTEEEREAKATTILFSKIPLIKDAYIHAEVEVQAKMNISADNTTGRVRVEAFYILNDESDRTMRPHPIAHTSVAKNNEYDTFRFLYWNPALKHEDNNYIGVKLLVSGGTAEIGISDNPEYGDAIITLTSAGLVGDNIDSGQPLYIELSGKEEVVAGYHLDINDYQVLAYYETGEVYNVTRLCEFDPEMGTEITEAVTTLTASYNGLYDYMDIYLGQVLYIELICAVEEFHGSYKMDISDFTVKAFFDNGDEWDVTNQCEFSPAMGTTLTADTTVTATYTPFWMHGQSFTDNIFISAFIDILWSDQPYDDGLIYTLYDDGYADITGTVKTDNTDSMVYTYDSSKSIPWTEPLEIGRIIQTAKDNGVSNISCIEWKAEGAVSMIKSFGSNVNYNQTTRKYSVSPKIDSFKGFENFDSSVLGDFGENSTGYPTSKGLGDSIKYTAIDADVLSQFMSYLDTSRIVALDNIISNSILIDNVDFMSNWDTSNVKYLQSAFAGSTHADSDFEDGTTVKYLTSLKGIRHFNLSKVTSFEQCFYNQKSIESINDLASWKNNTPASCSQMFRGCTSLESVVGIAGLNISDASAMFSDCTSLTRFSRFGGKAFNTSHCTNMGNMFNSCTMLEDVSGLNIDTSNVENMQGIFNHCMALTNISGLASWNVSKVETMANMFNGCHELINTQALLNWNVSSVTNMGSMFFDCSKLENISGLRYWDVSNVTTFYLMFYDCPKVVHVGPLADWNVSSAEALPMFERKLTAEDADDDGASKAILDGRMLDGWHVKQTALDAIRDKLSQVASSSSKLIATFSKYLADGSDKKGFISGSSYASQPAESAVGWPMLVHLSEVPVTVGSNTQFRRYYEGTYSGTVPSWFLDIFLDVLVNSENEIECIRGSKLDRKSRALDN